MILSNVPSCPFMKWDQTYLFFIGRFGGCCVKNGFSFGGNGIAVALNGVNKYADNILNLLDHATIFLNFDYQS
jgi:hypothetical protein